MEFFFQTVLAFLLTIVLGTRIAHNWQTRATKEARFYDASKEAYAQMLRATRTLTALIAKRIYASQRLCLSTAPEEISEAKSCVRQATVEWNENLLETELTIRTLFHDSHLQSFEKMQNELRGISERLSKLPNGSRTLLLKDLGRVRHRYFEFSRQMFEEAQALHRQMHFGVRLRYDDSEINKFSTLDLIKALFSGRVEGHSIVRSPSDFGMPVLAREARLGVYE